MTRLDDYAAPLRNIPKWLGPGETFLFFSTRYGQRVSLARGCTLCAHSQGFFILHYLVEQAGCLVTKEELLEAVWPDTCVQEEILKTCIRKLRQALGDNVQHPLFIETQVGRGYCFIAPVTEEVAAAPDLTAARVAERFLAGKRSGSSSTHGTRKRCAG